MNFGQRCTQLSTNFFNSNDTTARAFTSLGSIRSQSVPMLFKVLLSMLESFPFLFSKNNFVCSLIRLMPLVLKPILYKPKGYFMNEYGDNL